MPVVFQRTVLGCCMARHLSLLTLVPILCFSLLFPSISGAQPRTARMVGGQFVDNLASGPVALLLLGGTRCSGVLVGSREVLTAAHCVVGNITADELAVVVGGGVYEVESRYYNGDYDPQGDVELNGPYDLGMVILRQPVQGVSPVPVLFNDPVGRGEATAIFGFGTNERSGEAGRRPWEDGKSAVAVVSNVGNGLLSADDRSAEATICGGDSGGPMVQTIRGFFATVGIATLGENKIVDGYCTKQGNGWFAYVDLQSPTSQRFLLAFPGVTFISGYRIYVHQVANTTSRNLQRAVNTRSRSVFSRLVKSSLKSVRQALPYADGNRKTLLRGAAALLNTAQQSTSFERAKTGVKQALSRVKQVKALGVCR